MSKVEDTNKCSASTQTDSSVQSDVQLSVNSFFYTWTLSKFSECLKFSDSKVHSPEFTFENAKWRLWLLPVSDSGDLDEIRIRLQKTAKGGPGYYIKYKISLLIDDDIVETKEAASSFLGKSDWGHRLSFNLPLSIKNEMLLLKNDQLTVLCELLVMSSSVDGNDSVSLSNVAVDSKKKSTKSDSQISEAKIEKPLKSSTGILKCKENTKKEAKKAECASCTKKSDFVHLVLMSSIIFVLIIHTYSEVKKSHGLPLKAKEINELIIDSTLKIKEIAEVLNLTEVKIKSSELLNLYHKSNGFSHLEFPAVKVNLSESAVLNDKLNNTSGLKLPISNLVNSSYEFNDNKN